MELQFPTQSGQDELRLIVFYWVVPRSSVAHAAGSHQPFEIRLCRGAPFFPANGRLARAARSRERVLREPSRLPGHSVGPRPLPDVQVRERPGGIVGELACTEESLAAELLGSLFVFWYRNSDCESAICTPRLLSGYVEEDKVALRAVVSRPSGVYM